MENAIRVAAIGLLATFCALALKRDTPGAAYLLAAAAGTVIILLISDMLGGILDFCQEIAEVAGISGAVLSPLLKTLGIALVTQFAAEASRDAKESAIASYIEIGGMVAAMYVALPLMQSVLNLVSSLVG